MKFVAPWAVPVSRTRGQQDLIGSLYSLGLPLAELARRVGVPERQMRSWVRGSAVPSKDEAANIETTLGVATSAWSECPRPEEQETRNMIGFVVRGLM